MVAANDVATVIIARRGQWTDAWSLQKLLYYVQAWHAAITDKPLFEEDIQAWKDGPVVPKVWRSRQAQESRRAASQHVEDVALPEFASDLIDMVLGAYGSMSGEELRALTHVEEPWCDARGNLPEGASSEEVIPPAAMAAFYRANRKLGGRTAADLAAGGLHLMSHASVDPIDVDGILAGLSFGAYMDVGHDQWGGANLVDSEKLEVDGVQEGRHRSYSGA